MAPIISIICQEGGHAVALEYAKIVSAAGLPLLVNFPSVEGFLSTTQASQLINGRTGAAIVIVSFDLFPGSGRNPRFRIDTEVIHALLSAYKTDSGTRLYIVVIDTASEKKIESTWLSNIGWIRDGPITREEVLASLLRLATSGGRGDEHISSFGNTASIISAIEVGYTLTSIASEKVAADKIAYEVFKCSHKIWGDTKHYVHLHRGVTLANTARHLRSTHPAVYEDKQKAILLSMERDQVRPQDRIANIKAAFECQRVHYLEEVISTIINETNEIPTPESTHIVARKFVEPQVRKEVGSSNPPSGYGDVVDWLASPRSGVLVLVGQGGIGKTWVMMNLRQLVTARQIEFTKDIARSVVFISSTDIARAFSRPLTNTQEITLYDLYYASKDFDSDGSVSPHRLERETFYNALELGSLVVFVDGLDEIITRHRGRFNAADFFGDLNERLVGESDGKVIVSCRNIFFDHDEYRLAFPYVETYELLAFDKARRDAFFSDGLSAMPNRLAKAVELSDHIGRLPDGRYVPFVLDLVKEIIQEQADGATGPVIDRFQSSILAGDNPNDRIVGQFCHREMVKITDPVGELTVDEQVAVFCQIARVTEASKGRVDKAALTEIMVACLGKRGVQAHVEHFLTHPFVSQEEYRRSGCIDFRFDFMPEYFLMLDACSRMESERPIDEDDIRVFNKFCSINSPFCRGIVERLSGDASDLRFRLIRMNELAWELIGDGRFPTEDGNVLDPDSAIAHFSSALIALLATFEAQHGAVSMRSFTDGLVEVFGKPGMLTKMALLDGFVREEERLRVDFRGLAVDSCLFHSVDFWNCQFDQGTVFSRCRFMNCSGVYSKSSGVGYATFNPDCQFDADFERVLASGNQKVQSTEAQNIDAVRSFVSDFYKQGGFHRKRRDQLERFYGYSNSVIPFKKMYRLMKQHGVVQEEDRGHYTDVRISRDASAAAERLITQGVLSGPLEAIIVGLR